MGIIHFNTMSVTTVVCILAIACTVSGQVPGFGGCPNVEVMKGFDATKYTGTWYEFQRYFVLFELNGKCGKATYTYDNSDNSIIVENDGINKNTGKATYVKGKAAAPDSNVPAKLVVTFPTASRFAKGNYWVIDTDYENYSVVYSCNDIKLAHADIVWILSRDRKGLPEETTKKIYAKLESQGISTSLLGPIDQTNCPN